MAGCDRSAPVHPLGGYAHLPARLLLLHFPCRQLALDGLLLVAQVLDYGISAVDEAVWRTHRVLPQGKSSAGTISQTAASAIWISLTSARLRVIRQS